MHEKVKWPLSLGGSPLATAPDDPESEQGLGPGLAEKRGVSELCSGCAGQGRAGGQSWVPGQS